MQDQSIDNLALIHAESEIYGAAGIKKHPQAEAILSQFIPHSRGGRLIIKSWGYGFWSDVAHTLGGFLLAEITQRLPIVWWGEESLYSCPEHDNAYELYFASSHSSKLENLGADAYYPTFFQSQNIRKKHAFHQLNGEGITPWQLISAKNTTVVAGYHLSVHDLSYWITPQHHRYGQTLPELYRSLVRDYLQPQASEVAKVDNYIEVNLPEPYLALHLRGTDKESEIGNLSEINRNLLNTAKTMATQNGLNKVFVMTDCIQLEHAARKVLGGKAVFYSSRRSIDRLPLHLNNNQTSSEHGFEILIESYIASRADCFVGNGASNVAAMIAHLRDWSESQLHLLVPNQLYVHNPALYRQERFQ